MTNEIDRLSDELRHTEAIQLTNAIRLGHIS